MADDKPWWADQGETWADGEPAGAVSLFATAYPTEDQLATVARQAGLEPDATAGQSIEQTWRSVFRLSSSETRALHLAVQLLSDSGKSEFHDPLVRLLGDRAPGVMALGVVEGRQMPPPGASGASGLESLMSNKPGFTDYPSYLKAMDDHANRTARIERGGHAIGTGVLIGNDLLLTAAHVLDTEQWPPRDLDGVEAVFNFNSFTDKSLAETGTPAAVVEAIFGLPATKAEINQAVGEQDDAPSEMLDFGVVRLGIEIGRLPAAQPRQYYPLDESDYDLKRAPAMRIVSHPAGILASVSDVMSGVAATPKGTRIRYQSNTLPGSSGAPIVDVTGRLVGIHHYGFPGGRNRGVPYSLISRTIKASEYANLFKLMAMAPGAVPEAVARPFETTVLGGYPLVDRTPLREKLKTMATDNQSFRHLAIAGGPGSGKSYSVHFLTYVAKMSKETADLVKAAPGGIEVVVIDLRRYSAIALKQLLPSVARDLLSLTGLMLDEEKLAVKAQIAKTTIDRLTTGLRGSEKQWWLCFDSIDDVAVLRQSTVIELIRGVVELTRDFQLPIRVVLGGREVTELIQELRLNLPNQESAGNLLAEHVLDWVQAEASRLGRQVTALDLLAKLNELLGEELPGRFFPPEGMSPKDLSGLLPTFLERVSSKEV